MKTRALTVGLCVAGLAALTGVAIAQGGAPPAARMGLAPAPPPAAAPTATPAQVLVPASGRRDVDCLAQAVYYEARGESEAGQAAVAQVVINRTHQAGYPRTICGVVFQRARSACQFSFACHGAGRAVGEPAAWSRSRIVARRALAGYVMSAVGPATSFHASGRPAKGMVPVAHLGGHVFYCSRRRSRVLVDAASPEGRPWPKKPLSSSPSSRG